MDFFIVIGDGGYVIFFFIFLFWFYCILSIFFVLFVVFIGWDFGFMLVVECCVAGGKFLVDNVWFMVFDGFTVLGLDESVF